MAPPYCTPEGEFIDAGSTGCCVGLHSNWQGKCMSCYEENDECSSDDDCCSGLACVAPGVCKDLTSCGGSKSCCECLSADIPLEVCRSMGNCP